MGEWLMLEYEEACDGDEGGEPRCPVEGCDATGGRTRITGHEYTMALHLEPGYRTLGETWVIECDQGHSWDLEPMGDDSNLVRGWIHGQGQGKA
jgi:hypothetical protein